MGNYDVRFGRKRIVAGIEHQHHGGPGCSGRMAIRPFGIAAIALSLTLPIASAQEATPFPGVQPSLVATHLLPEIPLASLQNEALPDHPIADDRGMLLGGVGSDLWQGPDDADNEFWMVTDRGPNGEIEVDGEDRRTFPVPDFTPLILHVRAEDALLEVIDAIPIVNDRGEPVTGLSNLEEIDGNRSILLPRSRSSSTRTGSTSRVWSAPRTENSGSPTSIDRRWSKWTRPGRCSLATFRKGSRCPAPGTRLKPPCRRSTAYVRTIAVSRVRAQRR